MKVLHLRSTRLSRRHPLSDPFEQLAWQHARLVRQLLYVVQPDVSLTDEQPPLAYTVAEAATYLGVSIQTVYRGIHAGTIPVVRMTPAGRMLIPRAALERLLRGE
jgi:excisionase family DNA binding protein